jgi:hypothetical protein
MKHPSNREFFAYWDSKRGTARAPDRSEIDPNALRELLGDIFVLAYDVPSGHPFRVAGTRVCARFGCDLKNRSFASLFRPDSRAERSSHPLPRRRCRRSPVSRRHRKAASPPSWNFCCCPSRAVRIRQSA